jgi:hypothetical protein
MEKDRVDEAEDFSWLSALLKPALNRRRISIRQTFLRIVFSSPEEEAFNKTLYHDFKYSAYSVDVFRMCKAYLHNLI